MDRHRQQLPDYPQMYELSDPITNAAADEEASFMLYGQAAALSKEMPAGGLMDWLVKDARRTLATLM
ncbi:MAG: hypothetical protein AAFY99_06250 [Pseudomonadota bacterium]